MKISKLLLATTGAVVLLGALVSTASAARLSSSSQTFRAGFARVDFSGGFGTTECPLTLEGSMQTRTIAKVVGGLMGYITRATLGACTRGSATILGETLPWHIHYLFFFGTLPNVTVVGILISFWSLNIREPVFGVSCLASGGRQEVRLNREAGGVLTSAQINGRSPTSCGIEGTLSGTSNSLTVLGAATRITVTLI